MNARDAKKPFQFENMWVRHSGCEDIVKESWKSMAISNFKDLATGVQQCGKLLSKWNTEVFGNISHKIK